MAIVGDFGAAKAEADPEREPDQIRFFGELFTISHEIGTMPLLDFAAAAAAGGDSDTMEGLAAMHALLEDCLADGEFVRFRRVARKHKADGEMLMAVCRKVWEVISGRPTESPSGSAGGQSTTSPSSRPLSARSVELGLVPVDQVTLAG